MRISVSIADGPLAPRTYPRVDGVGALLCFEGLVRATEEGRPIDALDYEVYEPMATRMLGQLAEQIVGQFGLLAVFVEHSRGRVAAGECSFRLCVASSHRQEGLDALAWYVAKMKRDVPIWKRPVYAMAKAGV